MKTTASSLAAMFGLTLGAAAQAKINYTDHVLPIFRNACTNCHNPDKKKAGLDLTTYEATMAGGDSGASVKAGNADGSFLYQVSTHANEPTMPPKGDKLSEADLKTLKAWIDGFALETANSKPVVAAANKVEAAVVSLTRPEGPAPMPGDLPLDPFVKARPLGALTTLAASPWAPLVAVGGQKQVFLYHVENLQQLGVLAFPEGFPHVLRFSKNARLLLAGGGLGGKSGKVVLWDVTNGERVASVGNEVDAVIAADLSADQQFVALGGPDKRVKIYQTKDGKQTGLIKKHTEWITAITYSPDGKFLATADRNGGIEVWESAAEPKPFNTLAGHKSGVTALGFMPGVLASGSEDGTIKLWNVKEGTESKSWNAHPGGVLWVEFTPDGRLVSCGRDKVAKVWDATGKVLATTEAFGDLATRATLTAERVVAADWSGVIRVYALSGEKAQKVGELSANPPALAEQIAMAEKALAENTAALPSLQKALTEAEAKVQAEIDVAEAKRKADLAAVEGRRNEAQARLDAAKAAPGNAEKTIQEITAKLEAAKASLARAEQKQQEAVKLPADNENSKAARTEAVDAAKAALTEAQKQMESMRPQLESARQAFQKAKAEAPKISSEAEKIIAAANAEMAKLQTPITAPPVSAAKADAAASKIAELEKRLNDLNAKVAAVRAERDKHSPESPEYAKHQAVREELRPKVAAAEEALAKARESATLATPAQSEGQIAVAKAREALEAANAAIARARMDVDRLQRAQLYQKVFNARQLMVEKQAKYEDLLATAKDAYRQAEMTKAALADAQKLVTNSAKLIAEKEAALLEARKAPEAASAAVAAAEKAIADKKAETLDPAKIEAELAALTKQQAELNVAVNNARAARDAAKEGTAEHAAAKEKREALRAKETALQAQIAALNAKKNSKPGETPVPTELNEALKKAQLDLKLASDKLPPFEKALADAKATIAEAQKRIPELKARIPQLESEAARTRAQAEKAAVAAEREWKTAKADYEKLRAQYEATRSPPPTTASR